MIQLIKLQEIKSVFSINHAPILFLNKTSLLDLSNQKIETILNTNFELKEIINEFSSSPILKDQIINSNKNISSIIIYLKKNGGRTGKNWIEKNSKILFSNNLKKIN